MVPSFRARSASTPAFANLGRPLRPADLALNCHPICPLSKDRDAERLGAACTSWTLSPRGGLIGTMFKRFYDYLSRLLLGQHAVADR